MPLKHKYTPRTLQQKLGYLVEECGEVMAAAGKTLRWGLESFNPELPESERETNREWLLRELRDLLTAIKLVERALTNFPSPANVPEMPPIDPAQTIIENMKLKNLINEHIAGLPKPAADGWRKVLKEIEEELHG